MDELKAHYQRGGLGDVKIKQFLTSVMEELLEPIRERRQYYSEKISEVIQILQDGTKRASDVANSTLKEVRDSIGINFLEDRPFLELKINEYKKEQ